MKVEKYIIFWRETYREYYIKYYKDQKLLDKGRK